MREALKGFGQRSAGEREAGCVLERGQVLLRIGLPRWDKSQIVLRASICIVGREEETLCNAVGNDDEVMNSFLDVAGEITPGIGPGLGL